MKSLMKKAALLLLLIGVSAAIPLKTFAQGSISINVFYDDLSPYGQWIDDPDYGYVWVPDVDNDFRPYYSNGYWVMTEYGNTWVSDYDWGWAPFHYGRWVYNSYYGWVWVPGSEWAPAWVIWRNGGGYYGWAPLSPGISIGYSNYNCPSDWWVFVGPQYLYRTDFHQYWRGPRYNTTIINRTTYINNVRTNNYNHTRYYYGPRGEDIQRATHRSVPVYRLAESSRPGRPSVQRNTVNMYHPQTVSGQNTNRRVAPPRVIQAPKPVGRTQAATTSGRPTFRTEMQRNNNRPVQQQQQTQQGQRQQQEQQRQQQQVQRQQQEQQRQQQMQQRQQQEQQRQQQQVQRQQQEQQRQQQQVQRQQQDQQRQQQMQRQQQEQQRQQQQVQRQQQEQQRQQQQVQRQQQEQQRQQQMQQRQQQEQQRQQQQQRQQPQQQQQQRPEPPMRQQNDNNGGGHRR